MCIYSCTGIHQYSFTHYHDYNDYSYQVTGAEYVDLPYHAYKPYF